MAKSTNGEDKAAAKLRKQEQKKANKADKNPAFQTQVLVVTQGKVSKGIKLTREVVKKHSSPRKGEKPKRPTTAKFYKNRVEFKDGIILGNKKKKVLEYNQVKLIEQLDSDNGSQKAFVNYETPDSDYFCVMQLKDANEVSSFMNLVHESNANVDLRSPMAPEPDHSINDHEIEETTTKMASKRDLNGLIEDSTTYNADAEHIYDDEDDDVDENSLDRIYSRAESQQDRPWVTKSSFICADPHMIDDGTVYSHGTPETFGTLLQPSPRYNRRRESFDSYEDSDSHSRRHRRGGNNNLTTQYYYVGPTDQEDSVHTERRRSKPKKSYNPPPSRNQQYTYDYEDDNSISIAPSSIVTEVEYFTPEVHKKPKTPNARRPPSSAVRRPMSRKSSHRSKSRELPLSEAEKSRGGWHSDVMFVTPTKDGGVKVSADGPVMLYTATRANGNRDYDSEDDTTSDGESDFSYSSGSTLTLEDHAMPGPYGVTYSNGRR